MTSKDFIINKLNLLVGEIPDIKCSYKYDDFCLSHNIEILPSEMYHDSEKLKEKQFDILDSFYKAYSDEMVVFFTEDDLIELDELDFIAEGALYREDEKLSWINFVSSVSNKFDIGIKGVTGKVEYNNNYALAA